MKWSDSLAMKAALAVLATGGVLVNPLTTIDPCPSASGLSLAPITVTAQFQPVSTCVPTTACIKGKCTTTYPFTTYPYVSTVVPYAWNGTTTQVTTVTDVAQPFRVSEYLETVTQITAFPTPTTHHRAWFKANKKRPTATSTTVYETVTRRAMAPFNKIGPLPIPGWEGSGLCEECEHSQLLDVIECRSGINAGKAYNGCVQWEETLVVLPTRSSTVTTEALCSSQGKVPHAGVYTWTFPQSASPVTVTAPPATVTVTVNNRPSISVAPQQVQVIPGQQWDAYVTRSYSGPTTFNFKVYITKVIVFNIPHFTRPASSTRQVSIPTGSSKNNAGSSWPLPEQDPYYANPQAWDDWYPSSSSSVAPISASTSSKPTASVGPIGVSTTTTSSISSTTRTGISPSTTVSVGSSSASTSSGSLSNSMSSSTTISVGPISASTSTSSTRVSASSSSSSSSGSSSPGSLSSGMPMSTSATTSASGSASTTGTGFILTITATATDSALRARQTTLQYLGFSNNRGIAVEDRASAALIFNGNARSFVSEGLYLGTPDTEEYTPVERTPAFPNGFHVWFFAGIYAQLQGTAGFCLDHDGHISAFTVPQLCDNPISLINNPSADIRQHQHHTFICYFDFDCHLDIFNFPEHYLNLGIKHCCVFFRIKQCWGTCKWKYFFNLAFLIIDDLSVNVVIGRSNKELHVNIELVYERIIGFIRWSHRRVCVDLLTDKFSVDFIAWLYGNLHVFIHKLGFGFVTRRSHWRLDIVLKLGIDHIGSDDAQQFFVVHNLKNHNFWPSNYIYRGTDLQSQRQYLSGFPTDHCEYRRY
ncbi:hypothetical protein LTR46_011875 [Exophiala xenobiotica]|nr:hypothetical protein LTR46_011875 [Exophiala xenobiotica]